MTKKPINHWNQWTPEDIKQLTKLSEWNTPTPLIAYKLWRSPWAIYKKANEEKISLHPTNKSPYNRQK